MYLVFDIGGTNMRIAVSDDGKEINSAKNIPSQQNFKQGIEMLKKITQQLTKGEKITAIAGGIAGPLNKEKSHLVASPHLSGWIHKPLKKELEDYFKAPVCLENDTALVALGEAVNGAGKEKNIVAYIGIGTGVGGAKIVNQKIDGNTFGFEVGHQIITINGVPCHCGGEGHLEAYIGGSYLQQYHNKLPQEISDPKVWEKVAKYLAAGLTNTIVHWSPDIVILGGSVMQNISLRKVRSYLKHNLTIFPQIPELALAKLGNESGLYGALALLNQ